MKKTNPEMLLSAINRSLKIDISQRNRNQKHVFGRFVYFHYLKKFTNLSLSDIGRSCGDRDHATVLHAIKEFHNLKGFDKFIIIHDKCVRLINKTDRFPKVEKLQKTEPKPRKLVEYSYRKSEVKEVIRNAFLSNGITKDIMQMSQDEINEMITNKVKPHILMLRSRKNQTA